MKAQEKGSGTNEKFAYHWDISNCGRTACYALLWTQEKDSMPETLSDKLCRACPAALVPSGFSQKSPYTGTFPRKAGDGNVRTHKVFGG